MNITPKMAAIGIASALALTGTTVAAVASTTTESATPSPQATDSATPTPEATETEGTSPGSGERGHGDKRPGGPAGEGRGGQSGGPGGGPNGGGPGGRVDVSNVTTEEQLIELINEAYGDEGLGLHRGHQPVLETLEEVLGITHDEMHESMDAGNNLSATAEELGVDTQTLIDALVESWRPAIDDLLAAGTITQEDAEAYLAALDEAFTFKVTWDGETETPTFEGLDG